MILMIVLLVLMIPILAILLDSQLGRALASRLERRTLVDGDATGGERMAYLEGEVERLGSELARLDEESRFMTRLLSERAGTEGASTSLPRGDSLAADAGGDDA
jgi:hypothetical protein